MWKNEAMSITSTTRIAAPRALDSDIDSIIAQHAQELSEKLQAHRLELFPPSAEKTLRSFQVSEAAKLLGVKSGYLRNLSLDGKGPDPQVTPSGRRSYTAEQISRCGIISMKTAVPPSATCRAGAAMRRCRSSPW